MRWKDVRYKRLDFGEKRGGAVKVKTVVVLLLVASLSTAIVTAGAATAMEGESTTAGSKVDIKEI